MTWSIFSKKRRCDIFSLVNDKNRKEWYCENKRKKVVAGGKGVII